MFTIQINQYHYPILYLTGVEALSQLPYIELGIKPAHPVSLALGCEVSLNLKQAPEKYFQVSRINEKHNVIHLCLESSLATLGRNRSFRYLVKTDPVVAINDILHDYSKPHWQLKHPVNPVVFYQQTQSDLALFNTLINIGNFHYWLKSGASKALLHITDDLSSVPGPLQELHYGHNTPKDLLHNLQYHEDGRVVVMTRKPELQLMQLAILHLNEGFPGCSDEYRLIKIEHTLLSHNQYHNQLTFIQRSKSLPLQQSYGFRLHHGEVIKGTAHTHINQVGAYGIKPLAAKPLASSKTTVYMHQLQPLQGQGQEQSMGFYFPQQTGGEMVYVHKHPASSPLLLGALGYHGLMDPQQWRLSSLSGQQLLFQQQNTMHSVMLSTGPMQWYCKTQGANNSVTLNNQAGHSAWRSCGKMHQNIKKNDQIEVQGRYLCDVQGHIQLNIAGECQQQVAGHYSLWAHEQMTLQANTISFHASKDMQWQTMGHGKFIAKQGPMHFTVGQGLLLQSAKKLTIQGQDITLQHPKAKIQITAQGDIHIKAQGIHLAAQQKLVKQCAVYYVD